MLRFIVDVAIPHSFIKVLFHHFEVRHRNKSRSETRWRAAQRELCLHSTVVRRTLDCDRFASCFGGNSLPFIMAPKLRADLVHRELNLCKDYVALC